MKELTIEKLVPLLISWDWRKRLVGEYYETLIRQEHARNRIEILRGKLCTFPSLDLEFVKNEIDIMQDQHHIMKQYSDILYRRLARYGIQYVDILSEVLDATDVL